MTHHEIAVETIPVVVNGQVREVAAGGTVRALLLDLEIDPDVVVVERNGEILTRDRFAGVSLEPDDVLEIVHFVGGG